MWYILGWFATCFLAIVIYICVGYIIPNISADDELPPQHNFRKGDWVKLKETNPYKGTLKFGKSYQIKHTGLHNIMINAENSTFGYFEAKYFEKTDPVFLMEDGGEYDNIIASQEAMDAGA